MRGLTASRSIACVAGYLADELGRDVGFLQWMMLGVPIVITYIAVSWLLITRVMFRFDLPEVAGGKQMIDREISKLGTMTLGERMVVVVFAGAAFLWVVPGLLSEVDAIASAMPWLGGLDDTAIAIAAGLALSFLPGDREGAMVLGGVAVGIGVDPTTLLIPAALVATCAFMLPVGTPPNAIVFGTGAVTIREMVRGGLVLNIVGLVLITMFTVAIGPFALGLVI